MVFSFLLNATSVEGVNILCIFSFLVLGGLFWVYRFSWAHCWCHMMLSSRVALVSMALGQSGDLLWAVFFVYVVWASLVI